MLTWKGEDEESWKAPTGMTNIQYPALPYTHNAPMHLNNRVKLGTTTKGLSHCDNMGGQRER